MTNSPTFSARIYLILAAVFYICTFLFCYERWIVPRYESWGMGYRDVPLVYILTSFILCMVPACWLPCNLTRPSHFLLYIQYFIIFIPASFILYHSVRPELSPEDVFRLVLALFLGLTILQAGHDLPLFDIKRNGLPKGVFWIFFSSFALVLFIYLASVFGSHFQLADFQEIYDVRAMSDDIVEASESSFSGYSQMWLSGFVLPFLFSFGILGRRWPLVVISVGGYLYLLGIGGSKSTMLAPFYLFGIYFLVKAGGQNAAAKVSLFFSGLLLFPAALDIEDEAGDVVDIINTWYVAIVHARIFTIPQLTVGQYFDFFQNNALTHGSHITGVNLLVSFPYESDIPRTIGKYFYEAELTANANMWAQDGIASFGLIGILIVSTIAAAIFWLLDSVSGNHDPRFVTVALGNIALSFANLSLFTTIVSGGLLWLIIALYFYKE